MEDKKSLDLNNLLSLREAGSVSGFHENYLASLIRNKKLQAVKVGFAWFIQKEELQKFLDLKVKYQRNIPPVSNSTIHSSNLPVVINLPPPTPQIKKIENKIDDWDKKVFENIPELSVKDRSASGGQKNYLTFKLALKTLRAFLVISTLAFFFFISSSSTPSLEKNPSTLLRASENLSLVLNSFSKEDFKNAVLQIPETIDLEIENARQKITQLGRQAKIFSQKIFSGIIQFPKQTKNFVQNIFSRKTIVVEYKKEGQGASDKGLEKEKTENDFLTLAPIR